MSFCPPRVLSAYLYICTCRYKFKLVYVWTKNFVGSIIIRFAHIFMYVSSWSTF
ncbi:hypothetical protein Hanom_Chr03g00257821 [Helianthus anomalus]